MDLNDNQKKAVEHVEGPLLVLAGAGSGKTKVVTRRIAHLMDLGVLPAEILALTFTNKAAQEMSSRIQKTHPARVLTTTFHSLGARILRESIDALGYKKSFTIYDEDDSQKLLKSAFEEIGLKGDKALLRQNRADISRAKNQLITPEKMETSPFGSKCSEFFPRLYATYQSRLRQANALDFDDLLFLPLLLFEQDATIASLYQNRWLFLLIDEYQDTNYAQYKFAKILTEKHQNIFAVGDPDQSIYSWRGALVQNILNFQKDFAGATIITLEENYRSTNRILKAANALIVNNESRYEKKLWSGRGEGEKVGIFVGQTDQEETRFVVDTLERVCKERHIPFEDAAIFYRTNAQSRVLEDGLLARRIPYQIIGGLSFYQRKEIKDVVAFLRLLVSPSDVLAFTRTISTPKRGIGPSTLEKLLKASGEANVPILTYLEEMESRDSFRLSKKQKEGLSQYLEGLRRLRASWKKQPSIALLIAEVLKACSYEEYLREDPDTYEDRKANIEALTAKAMEWHEERPHPSLHDFLEELSLSPSSKGTDPHAVKLMTLHNAKGLEFPLVFIVGLEEDVLPHANAKYGEGDLEEERRLCYVGITRARKFLFLSAALEKQVWGSKKRMQPSRFLTEIPAALLENYSPTEKERSFSSEGDDFLFAEGDWVLHGEFGKGIIQKTYYTSYGPTYDVYFVQSESERSLVAKYAKLQSFR